jgi:Flp pilus assembly protein TadG
VTVEFAIIVAFILPVLIFGIIDFGRLIYARQIVSEVSRVGGGSVLWRAEEYGYIDIENANNTQILFDMLEDAGSPIFDDNARCLATYL